MKKTLIVSMVVVAMPFMVWAQTNLASTTPRAIVVLQDPGLIPGDFFYFLDQWMEAVNYFITFKTESKAMLALEHAKERASEVRVVLKEKGFKSREVAQAKQDFVDELNRAATIIADKKAKGGDVAELAKEIDDHFKESQDMLKEAYRSHRDELKTEKKNLKEKLKNSLKAGDAVAQARIEAEIKSINEDMSDVLDEEGSIEVSFNKEKNDLNEAMGEKTSAEKHIINAEQAYASLVKKAQAEGIPVDQGVVLVYTKLIASAKVAFSVGDFESAKEDAKDAKKELDDVDHEIETKDIDEDFLEGDKNEKDTTNNGKHGDRDNMNNDQNEEDRN